MFERPNINPVDGDSAGDGEAGEKAKKRQPVSFDSSRLEHVSRERRNKVFKSQRALSRDVKTRGRRQTWISRIAVTTVAIAAVSVGLYSVNRMAQNSRETREKLARAENTPERSAAVPAGARAPGENAAPQAPPKGGASAPAPGPVPEPGSTPEPHRESAMEESLAEARKLLEENKTADAKKLLNVLARKYPSSPEVWILHGYSILAAAPPNAGAYARRALDIDPGNREALDLLSSSFEVTRAKGLKEETERKLVEMEIKHYVELRERLPGSPELLYRSASQRIALHKLDPSRQEELVKAIAELDTAIGILSARETPGELASAHHQKGRAIKHQGDDLLHAGEADAAEPFYEKAVNEFRTALETDGNRVDSLGEIILIRTRQGRTPDAVAAAEAALAAMDGAPFRAKALEMLGVLCHQSGDHDRAEEHYLEALSLNGRLSGCHLGLAGIHSARGDADAAVASLRQSVEADPDFLEGHVRLGQLLADLGRSAEAARRFEIALQVPRERARTIAMNPSKNIAKNRFYYTAASALAWIYAEEEDDVEKASRAVQMAQSFQEADPHLIDTSGWIYYKLGNYEVAETTFLQAIELTGGFPAAHYHLAAARAKLGKSAEALADLRKALEADGEFAWRPDAEALERELETGGQ